MRPSELWLLSLRSCCLALCLGNAITAQCTSPASMAGVASISTGCGSPQLGVSPLPVFGTVVTLRTTNLPPNTWFVVTWVKLTAPGAPTTDLCNSAKCSVAGATALAGVTYIEGRPNNRLQATAPAPS